MNNSEVSESNDLFRRSFKGGRVVLTRSVRENESMKEVIRLVQEFNDFDEDNDPYQEHDFGCVTVKGQKFFWKIDYYDSNYEFGLDPTDANVHRVLTIMRSDEY